MRYSIAELKLEEIDQVVGGNGALKYLNCAAQDPVFIALLYADIITKLMLYGMIVFVCLMRRSRN